MIAVSRDILFTRRGFGMRSSFDETRRPFLFDDYILTGHVHILLRKQHTRTHQRRHIYRSITTHIKIGHEYT